MSKADDGGLFWERQEGESSTAFMAFATYRDQGITRSLRSAAAAFYAHDGDGPQAGTEGTPNPGAGALRRFKEWSRQNLWTARVEAFDAHEARERSLQMRKYRDEMIETHHKIAKLGEKALAKKLYEIARGEDFISSSALHGLLTAVTNLHRLTLGEATERLEQLDGEKGSVYDFSKLSDAELDEFLRLSEKVFGG